ncbi:hypothetical protein TI03_05535 [Achromatium sp. WMS1]|nr:hypothetical protein TI03_05535 [Achromatium sp. WMS1]
MWIRPLYTYLYISSMLLFMPPIYADVPLITILKTVTDISKSLGIVADKAAEVQQTQLNELRSRVTGIVSTIKERYASGISAHKTLQDIDLNLNQTLDMTYGMAQIYANRAANISATLSDVQLQQANIFVQLHEVLEQLKIKLYKDARRNNVTLTLTNEVLHAQVYDACILIYTRRYLGKYAASAITGTYNYLTTDIWKRGFNGAPEDKDKNLKDTNIYLWRHCKAYLTPAQTGMIQDGKLCDFYGAIPKYNRCSNVPSPPCWSQVSLSLSYYCLKYSNASFKLW